VNGRLYESTKNIPTWWVVISSLLMGILNSKTNLQLSHTFQMHLRSGHSVFHTNHVTPRASKHLLSPCQLNSALCSLYMDKHDHESKAALRQHFEDSEIQFGVKKPSGHQDLTFTSIEQRNLFIDGFSAHGANLQRRCTFNTRAMSTQESHIARFFQTYGAHVSILDFPDMRLKG